MRVSEIFYSLQGEGMLVGTPSVFVRLAGCPFRCRWCDTAYAWDYAAGEDLDPDQIVAQVNRWSCGFVVLTGGEPMIGPDLSVRPGLADLTRRLKALGKHITIETAGACFVPGPGLRSGQHKSQAGKRGATPARPAESIRRAGLIWRASAS